MGTYARVVVKYKAEEGLVPVPDELELPQGYCGFAVLAGTRNIHSIVPMFPVRDEHPLVTAACKADTSDCLMWANLDEVRYGLFRGYFPKTWFTLDELAAFDFDQPLAFLPKRKPLGDLDQHRAIEIQDGDTYRSFIERETSLFAWFEKLKQEGVELVIVAFD